MSIAPHLPKCILSSLFKSFQKRSCLNCPFADLKWTHVLSFVYMNTCSVSERGNQKSWKPEEQQWVILLQAELVQSTQEQKAGAVES